MLANKPRAGFTLVEMTVVIALLFIMLGGLMAAINNIQGAFAENQTIANLTLRAENALNRVVAMASQAVTVDAEFTPIKPDTGVDSHGLQFRLIDSFNNGTPVYDDAAVVFILGPDAGAHPCAGLIIGRGATLDDVYNTARGADNTLGTTDDDTSFLIGTDPVLEMLLPSTFAPANGDMFQIDVDPTAGSRLLTVTIRVNVRGSDGQFVLNNDLVLTERIALRQ